MYDYNNARFLSIDPFIQAPTSTQSMNPYTYIFNNPLSGVDPTGYSSITTGFKTVSGVCLDGKGCIGGGANDAAMKNGVIGKYPLVSNDVILQISDTNSQRGATKLGVCCDFAEIAKQPTPQERWDKLSLTQKLLSFFSPLVAMNEEESRNFINNSCGGECSKDFTEQEIADFRERARQFGEFTERVIGFLSGGRLSSSGQKAAARTMTARSASVGGGLSLKVHELAGGHLIERHVGRTASQLLQRLRDQPRITGASSFGSLSSAELAVNTTLNANKATIKAFLQGNRSSTVINHTFQNPVGISVMRGSTTVSPASGVRLVLKRDSSLSTGFRVHTGFPTL